MPHRTLPIPIIAEHAARLLRGDHLAAAIAFVERLALAFRNAHGLLMAAFRAGDVADDGFWLLLCWHHFPAKE